MADLWGEARRMTTASDAEVFWGINHCNTTNKHGDTSDLPKTGPLPSGGTVYVYETYEEIP
jgi:hypothetical protein